VLLLFVGVLATIGETLVDRGLQLGTRFRRSPRPKRACAFPKSRPRSASFKTVGIASRSAAA
jgi:hypothetical protein